MVAAKMANMTKSDGGRVGAERQGKASANLHIPPVSQESAAKLMNVSPRQVTAAEAIEKATTYPETPPILRPAPF